MFKQVDLKPHLQIIFMKCFIRIQLHVLTITALQVIIVETEGLERVDNTLGLGSRQSLSTSVIDYHIIQEQFASTWFFYVLIPLKLFKCVWCEYPTIHSLLADSEVKVADGAGGPL